VTNFDLMMIGELPTQFFKVIYKKLPI